MISSVSEANRAAALTAGADEAITIEPEREREAEDCNRSCADKGGVGGTRVETSGLDGTGVGEGVEAVVCDDLRGVEPAGALSKSGDWPGCSFASYDLILALSRSIVVVRNTRSAGEVDISGVEGKHRRCVHNR